MLIDTSCHMINFIASESLYRFVGAFSFAEVLAPGVSACEGGGAPSTSMSCVGGSGSSVGGRLGCSPLPAPADDPRPNSVSTRNCSCRCATRKTIFVSQVNPRENRENTDPIDQEPVRTPLPPWRTPPSPGRRALTATRPVDQSEVYSDR